jgi:hypothetical protein
MEKAVSALSRASIALGFADDGTYQHYIQTRHNNAADNNSINFYTSDGTENSVFPTNSVHGMTIENGSVGVGTTDPQQKLDVNGTIKATLFTNGDATVGTTDLGLYSQSAAWVRYVTTGNASHVWYTNGDAANNFAGGTNIMLLNSGRLDVKTQIIGRNFVSYNSATDTQSIRMHNNGNGIINNNGGSLALFTTDDFRLHNDGARTLTVLANGNTGIGVGNPSAKLHVNGAIRVGTNDAATNPDVEGMIRYNGTNFQGYTSAGWVNLN